MLHDVVQRKKFYTLVLQKCLTRSIIFQNLINQDFTLIAFADIKEKRIADIKNKYHSNQRVHIIGGDIKEKDKNKDKDTYKFRKAHYLDYILENFMEFEEDENE